MENGEFAVAKDNENVNLNQNPVIVPNNPGANENGNQNAQQIQLIPNPGAIIGNLNINPHPIPVMPNPATYTNLQSHVPAHLRQLPRDSSHRWLTPSEVDVFMENRYILQLSNLIPQMRTSGLYLFFLPEGEFNHYREGALYFRLKESTGINANHGFHRRIHKNFPFYSHFVLVHYRRI